ncbi:MAG: substrate-binding domain-containing protein [Anaerolineae bacterium]|nr:substrate-binding domain-containing protein [Anaerolineae bacterium]
MVKKQLSRRDFIKITGMVAAAGLLASCQPATEEPMETGAPDVSPPEPDAIEIVHWVEHYLLPENEDFKEYQDAAMEAFHEKYPNVTVKAEDHGWDEALRQNLVTALLGGTAPDVIVGENFFQQYGDLGALMPMDDYIQDIEDNLIPGTYAAAVTKGQVYGINQFTGCFGFERNPNVIEAAGLDPSEAPKTWDDLLEQAETITKAGDGEYYGYTLQGPVGFSVGGIFRVAVYLKQASADIAKEDGYPWFDNPKTVPVLEFLRKINAFTPPGLTFNPDEGQVYTQLFKGVSAYQICGSWHVGWAKDSGLDNAMYSGVPIPKDGKPASVVVGNVINAVLTVSKHPEISAEWIKVFTEDRVQDLVNPVLGRMPSTKSALNKLKSNASEADLAFINELLNADLGILPQWRQDPQKLWTIYNDLLTQVLSTEAPINDLIGTAQQTADEVMG